MADRNKRLVDPLFYIPEGIFSDVWEYRENYSPMSEEDEAVLQSDVTLIDEGDDSTDDSPDAIESLSVISQTLRRSSDGAVVDIVVEVDDIPGVTKYEFRVTKV